MQSIIEILKVNELRSGTKDGRQWTFQDAECLLRDDTGAVVEVGVLPIPEAMREQAKPGVFIGTFALRASKMRDAGRRIEPVLTGLQPYAVKVSKAAQ